MLAYILARAKIIPDDATLDAQSLPKVQMPNRNGFIADPRPDHFPPAAKVSKAALVNPQAK